MAGTTGGLRSEDNTVPTRRIHCRRKLGAHFSRRLAHLVKPSGKNKYHFVDVHLVQAELGRQSRVRKWNGLERIEGKPRRGLFLEVLGQPLNVTHDRMLVGRVHAHALAAPCPEN